MANEARGGFSRITRLRFLSGLSVPLVFIPEYLSHSHENFSRVPSDLSVGDSHRRSKPPPKKLADFLCALKSGVCSIKSGVCSTKSGKYRYLQGLHFTCIYLKISCFPSAISCQITVFLCCSCLDLLGLVMAVLSR